MLNAELQPTIFALMAAAGIGLLIGVERERNKGEHSEHPSAGVRSFTLFALLGAVCALLGVWALIVGGAFVGLLAITAYRASVEHDPGLTSEIAMLVTYMLGALAVSHVEIAAALGVCVAVLLAAKSRMHGFIRQTLTADEIRDGLLLAASALVILPLIPEKAIDPQGVLNVHKLWSLVVLIMAIGAAGHVALRAMGGRYGLPLTGFIGGFVSSSATIAAMATRARREPASMLPSAAAAMASSIATCVLMAVLLFGVSLSLLQLVWPIIAVAGLTAVLSTVLLTLRSPADGEAHTPGRAFSLRAAVALAVILGLVLWLAALLNHWLGAEGVWIGLAIAGFADVHAATLSAGQLVASEQLSASEATIPLLLAFATNTLTKLIVARNGGSAFFWRVLPGHVAMLLAACLTAWVVGLLG